RSYRARIARGGSGSRSVRSTSCYFAPCAHSAGISATAPTCKVPQEWPQTWPEIPDCRRHPMATQDDDTLTGSVPDPETEPTKAERAHARRFADLVDKTLSGRTPPAMSADDRALLEVATVIRATRGNLELPPSVARSVVEDALRQAIGGEAAGTPASAPFQRARIRRWGPWIVAGTSTLVAAAAIATLWLRAPAAGRPVSAQVPSEWTSRPADAVVGPIARDRAGDASSRIDAIFADRLDGFRARRLARGGKP